MRLNLEMPEERVKDLKELQAETSSETIKELINNALSMLEWAVNEVKAGNEIAAVDENERVRRIIVTPLLTRVAKKYSRDPALTQR